MNLGNEIPMSRYEALELINLIKQSAEHRGQDVDFVCTHCGLEIEKGEEFIAGRDPLTSCFNLYHTDCITDEYAYG